MSIEREKIQRVEDELRRIRHVNHASIHLDLKGEIEQIDLMSGTDRPPRPIVRDAEAILRRHDLTLDHRKIGVVQLESPPSMAKGERRPPLLSPAPLPTRRVRLSAVHSTIAEGNFVAEVELCLGAYEGAPGRAEGPARDEGGHVDVVARAAAEAVRNLLKPGYEVQFRGSQVGTLGGVRLVTVLFEYGRGREARRLAGACADHGSLYEATVYACLDALNRSLDRAEYRDLMVQDEDATPEQLSWRAASA